MRFQVTSKTYEITPPFRAKIISKFEKIDRYLKDFEEDLKEAVIVVSENPRYGYKFSFSLALPGREKIFAEASHKNITSALIECRDDAERQVRDFKDKLQDY